MKKIARLNQKMNFRLTSILLLLLFINLSFIGFAQKQKSLFNGKNLDGWTINGTEKWYVDKGELVCESGPDKQYGYLSTNKSYKNFILTVTQNFALRV